VIGRLTVIAGVAALHGVLGPVGADTGPPAQDAPAPDVCIVRLDTTKGTVDIEVARAWAPRGADRFIALVRSGYYDRRWTQFGINGDPVIAKAWRTRTIPDDPFRESNVRGTVAFAFAVPNGRTTQVFFNLGDNSATHDREPFTPFGRVLGDGMKVVEAFNAEHREGPGGIRAGGQDPFFDGGNAWLDRQFPRLDAIVRATVRTRTEPAFGR
jgi:cyclophilin family peptidyl-prolyl cis-trans isomerase